MLASRCPRPTSASACFAPINGGRVVAAKTCGARQCAYRRSQGAKSVTRHKELLMRGLWRAEFGRGEWTLGWRPWIERSTIGSPSQRNDILLTWLADGYVQETAQRVCIPLFILPRQRDPATLWAELRGL